MSPEEAHQFLSNLSGSSKSLPSSQAPMGAPPVGATPADKGRAYPNWAAMGAVGPLMGLTPANQPSFVTPAPAFAGDFWKNHPSGAPVSPTVPGTPGSPSQPGPPPPPPPPSGGGTTTPPPPPSSGGGTTPPPPDDAPARSYEPIRHATVRGMQQHINSLYGAGAPKVQGAVQYRQLLANAPRPTS